MSLGETSGIKEYLCTLRRRKICTCLCSHILECNPLANLKNGNIPSIEIKIINCTQRSFHNGKNCRYEHRCVDLTEIAAWFILSWTIPEHLAKLTIGYSSCDLQNFQYYYLLQTHFIDLGVGWGNYIIALPQSQLWIPCTTKANLGFPTNQYFTISDLNI